MERRPYWNHSPPFEVKRGGGVAGLSAAASDAPDIVGSCALQSLPLSQNLLGSSCGVGTLHFSVPEALESLRGLV